MKRNILSIPEVPEALKALPSRKHEEKHISSEKRSIVRGGSSLTQSFSAKSAGKTRYFSD